MIKKIKYFFEAVIAYIIYGFFAILPSSLASNIGGWLGRNIGIRLGVTKRARKNLKQAFPSKTDTEIEQIITDMWENLGRVLAEYPHLKKIAQNVKIENKEILDNIANSNKPAILISGHLANWELLIVSAKLQSDLDISLSYRKLNNPFVNKLLMRARNVGTKKQIAKSRKSVIEIAKTLKSGGKVGILIDQKLNEGIAVPFFGQEAMTTPIVPQLAKKFDVAVYLAKMERVNKTEFKLIMQNEFKISNEDKDFDVMLNIHKILEQWIKEKPAQWLWIHNRWGNKK